MTGRAPVLLTGFEPFAGLRRNPSAQVVRRLSRDAACRAAGLRTAVLPVDRRRSVEGLAGLLKRHRPETLLLTGVAVGRPAPGLERTAVNVWRGHRGRGCGQPIRRGAPDGLFSSAPLAPSLRALRRAGPAELSESAGTYCCNLVLYEALRWEREGTPWGGPAPRWTAFVHLPATSDCGAPAGSPTCSSGALQAALKNLVMDWIGRLPG